MCIISVCSYLSKFWLWEGVALFRHKLLQSATNYSNVAKLYKSLKNKSEWVLLSGMIETIVAWLTYKKDNSLPLCALPPLQDVMKPYFRHWTWQTKCNHWYFICDAPSAESNSSLSVRRGQLRKGQRRELLQELIVLIWSHTCSWFVSVCTWGAFSDQLGGGKQAGNNTVYVGTEKRSEDFSVTFNEDSAEAGNSPWQSGHSCQALRRHQRV